MGKWLGKVLLISGWLVSGMVLAEEPFFQNCRGGVLQMAGEVVLTRAEFEACRRRRLKTGTPWTEGEHPYRGCCCGPGQDLRSQEPGRSRPSRSQ